MGKGQMINLNNNKFFKYKFINFVVFFKFYVII